MFCSTTYLQHLRASTSLAGHYPSTLDGAMRHPRLQVVGEANSGKTTFLRHLAYLWAGGMLDVRVDTLLFPLLICGAGLAAHLDQYPNTADAPRWLAAFLDTRSQDCHWGLDEEFFRVRLARGACLLLLDGLDQIPRGRARDAIIRILECQASAGPLSRVVVATRPGSEAQLAGFVTVRIGPSGA